MSVQTNIVEFLHVECGLCFNCIHILIDANYYNEKMHDANNPPDDYCTICFGLLSPNFQKKKILPAIRESLLPYGSEQNLFSRESPTVQIPMLIQVRAHCAVVAAKWYQEKNGTIGQKIRTAEEVYASIKDVLKSSLKEMLDSLVGNDQNQESSNKDIELPNELQNEEAGYLSIHIIANPPTINKLDPNKEEQEVASLIPPSLKSLITNQKEKITQSHYKVLNPRARFRGNDPTLKQGGDPRKNMELRMRRDNLERNKCIGQMPQRQGNKRRRMGDDEVKKESQMIFNQADWNIVIAWLDKETVNQWIKEGGTSDISVEWLQKVHKMNMQSCDFSSDRDVSCSVAATTWRKPFCIHGYYTKTRRDVSQTPFYVIGPGTKDATQEAKRDNNKSNTNQLNTGMIRKGISSVEEEICPHVANLGCGRISTKNNDPKSSLVYGMCKFHASGREDMDVRMLLPVPSVVEACAKKNSTITGRPFVCEIIDAHRLPTISDLVRVEDTINGTIDSEIGTSQPESEIQWDERGWPQTLAVPNRSYGQSPNGVGVSSLKFVPSSVFSTLQSETENKVKHYGCICWSEQPIESDEQLVQKLGCSPWDKGDNDNTMYPLTIQQSTPLRVLHRRSSDVRTRCILSLSAFRIDDHWFRLRMSTSAGTYVKEFVHGDCGRTFPSVRSMLGSRTDITELDCEGIVFD